jgi:hypothetical protein
MKGLLLLFALPTALVSTGIPGSSHAMAGSWSGRFEVAGKPPVSMDLTLSPVPSGWSATGRFRLTDKEFAEPIRDLRISGADISFRARFHGADVSFVGKLKAGRLRGKLDAIEGGRAVGSGTWELVRSNSVPSTQTPGRSAAAAGTTLCVQVRERIHACKDALADEASAGRPSSDRETIRRQTLDWASKVGAGPSEVLEKDCTRQSSDRGQWSRGWIEARRSEFKTCIARPACKETAACLFPLVFKKRPGE